MIIQPNLCITMPNDNYYYKSELTEEGYSTTQSSVLSVSRMLQHKPFWRQAFGPVLMKKKVLILNDPALNKLGESEDIVALELFQDLQDKGFKFYFNDNEQLFEIDTKSLSSLKNLVSPKPKTDKKISEDAAKQLQLSHDEIFILNHEEFTKLIQGVNEEWVNLNSFETVNFEKTNINIASLSELLKRSGNKIKSLNLSECINLKTGTLSEVFTLDKLEELFISSHDYRYTYKHRINNLDKSSIKHLIKSAPNLKTLSLPSRKDLDEDLINNSNFALLETLDLSDSNIDYQLLKKILAKAVKLKKLNLRNCSNIGLNDESGTALNFALLEELDLFNSNVNCQSLSKLLANAPKLKKLNLGNCSNIGLNDESLTALKLPSLEELDLSFSNISNQSFGKLLANAPKLKKINLSGCQNLNLELISTLNLTCLEEIDLDGCNINCQTLSKILAKAPHLKRIYLKECPNLDDELVAELNLGSLEDINLFCSNIGSQSLSKLLANAPKLNTLFLSNCKNLGDALTTDLNLPCLKELDLTESNINSHSLSKLLANAPKLDTLYLNDCQNLGDDLTTDLNLPCLEELYLHRSNISCQNLSKILANTKNLKILGMSECTNLNHDITTEINTLCLTSLNLSNSNISSQPLGKILAKAPKLKELYLSGCQNLNDDLTTDINLSCLESLNLNGATIDGQSLLKILNKAPKLKTLHMDCTTPLYNFAPDCNLPDLEELAINSAVCNIVDLLTKTPKLKSLKLIDYDNYLPSGINFASLDNLDLSQCNMHPYIIQAIHSQAPHLKIICPGGEVFSPEEDTPIEPEPSANASAVRGISHRETERLDGDTRYDPNKKFVLDRLFYASDSNKHPHPSNYRENIFNQFETNKKICAAGDAFALSNTSADWAIKACTIHQSTEDLRAKLPDLPDASQCFYSSQTIPLSEQWQPLASLSPEEVMTEYRLSPAVDVEIGYSQRDNLYCIRKKPETPPTNKPITIEFIVRVPPASQNELPLDIKNKINECLKFGQDSLQIKQEATGADYLEALKTQKVGACRHRAAVFKAWMDEREPLLPSRIVNNKCHSFVEVFDNNHWISCDLGGYPAQLVIYEQNKTAPVIQQLMTGTDAIPTGTEKNTKRYFTQEALEKNKAASALEYMQHVLSSPGHKKLIQVANEHSLNGFRHHLQKYCHDTSRPCFYIQSPADLICAAAYIQRKGTTGHIKKGPGGPLHDFLMQHSNDGSKPVLIVNYDQFSAQDIVRFNALLDKERFADGSPVPAAAQVIGIMNPGKPGAYDGADFRSRFDAIIPNSLSDELLAIPPVTAPALALTKESQKINLYNRKEWEDNLLGHWVLKGNQLQFIEGELLTALKNNKTHIELNNAPWNDNALQAFWQNALLCGSFHAHGTEYQLPKGFKLSQSQGYSFEKTRQLLKINEDVVIPADALVLNRSLLGRFFNEYRCNSQDASIHYEEGILKKNQKKTINLYLSDSLDVSSWALLLDQCQQHEVRINLTLAPGVTIPDEIGIPCPIKPQTQPASWPFTHLPTTAYVQSTDVDVTLRQLPEDSLIIDVSELSSADLLMKLDGRFDEKDLKFHFNEQEGILLKTLKNNKTVVLKGSIPEELRQVLSEFLLKRHQQATPKGHVVVLSDQPHLFPMLPSSTHKVTPAEKKKWLKHQFAEEVYTEHSLAALQAMARYLTLNPGGLIENAWQGMKTLPAAPAVAAIELKNAEQAVAAFNLQRLTAVEQALQQGPFVFLAGITGVGKTTFVHEVWKKKHAKVYLGEANKLAWAKDQTPGIKTLFIDEANISSRQWSEFEGLFHNPPSILINNEIIELTKDHKVIFAGNPLSYGGERQMPSLFTRHGNSVLFNPLPPAYLYHEILKPVFTQARVNNSEALALPILEVTQYCNRIDETKVRITPREQGMMALLTVSYCRNNPKADATKVAQYYAYTLAERFVPAEKKEEFAARFKPREELTRASVNLSGDLVINAKNQAAFDNLRDLLDLRRLRQSANIQADGGLGGLIIEGEPGIGKTELVIHTLLAYGLKKGALNREHPEEPVFYVVPVSMSYEEKAAVLLKAFHEGAPVVMDEINSAPMMEQLLNDLLMGKDPKGNKAKKPGFVLLGTQNPPTMAGRTRPSTALEHRMQHVVIAEYLKEEMIKILVSKGLPEDISQEMVDQYLSLRQQALLETSTPLCFRDLIRQAEFEITAFAHLAKQLQAFLKLLDGLKSKQTEYLGRHPDAHAQAQELIDQLENKAKAFYSNPNPNKEEVQHFKGECIEAIKQNSSLLKEHRAFFGALFAAIHQFFKALKAFVLNEPTRHGFFDNRSKGAVVADDLMLDINQFSNEPRIS